MLSKAWGSAIESFELYLTRIDDCRAYTEATGDAISDKQTVDLIVSNFKKTAEYPDYVKDWNRKTRE